MQVRLQVLLQKLLLRVAIIAYVKFIGEIISGNLYKILYALNTITGNSLEPNRTPNIEPITVAEIE